MARFRVEIFKRLNNETWENRWYIETVSFTTAPPLVDQIVAAERNIHSDQVTFTYARVSTIVEGDDLFLNLPINLQGQLAASTTGGLLPLWNVAKVYFAKDLQRPDYKLFRGVLGEGNTESGQVTASMVTTITNSFTPLVLLDPQIVFPESGTYTNVNTDNLIRQRDVHRRRRRSATSGLVTPS